MYAPRSAIELGAGCGSVGIALWRRGCKKVTLTDLDEMLPILRTNIARNLKTLKSGEETNEIVALPLDWSDDGSSANTVRLSRGPFDLIVGAEISYDEHLHADFVSSLERLCRMPSLVENRNIDREGRAKTTDRDVDRAETADTMEAAHMQTRIVLAIPLRDKDTDVLTVAKKRGFVSTQMALFPPTIEHQSPIGIFELVLLH